MEVYGGVTVLGFHLRHVSPVLRDLKLFKHLSCLLLWLFFEELEFAWLQPQVGVSLSLHFLVDVA